MHDPFLNIYKIMKPISQFFRNENKWKKLGFYE